MSAQSYQKISIACTNDITETFANFFLEHDTGGLVVENDKLQGQTVLTAYLQLPKDKIFTEEEIEHFFFSVKDIFPEAKYSIVSLENIPAEDWLAGWVIRDGSRLDDTVSRTGKVSVRCDGEWKGAYSGAFDCEPGTRFRARAWARLGDAGKGGEAILFARYVRERGYTQEDAIRVETLAGIVTPRWLGDDQVEIQMTRPVLDPEKIPTRLRGPVPLVEVPLEVEGQVLRVTPVSMGNPHCVVFVEDPEEVPVERLGPALEHHPHFPARTNVEFVAISSRRELRQRTWERGTGETLACGSGACAAAVAAALSGRADRELLIRLRGGELRTRWPDSDGPVWLTGPTAHVFDGEILVP